MATTFARYQVLRTNKTVKADVGNGAPVEIPKGTRVTVLMAAKDGRWKLSVADPRLPDLRGKKFLLGASRLKETNRGRPTFASLAKQG